MVCQLVRAGKRDGTEAKERADRAEPLEPLRKPHQDDVARPDPADVEPGGDAPGELVHLLGRDVVEVALRTEKQRPHAGTSTVASPLTTQRSPMNASVESVARPRPSSTATTSTTTRTSSPGRTGARNRSAWET